MRVRVIQFERAEPSRDPRLAGTAAIACVRLDGAIVAGIRCCDGEWRHLLADGATSGLVSRVSRHDLERQVTRYHLETLPGAMPPRDAPTEPLRLAT